MVPELLGLMARLAARYMPDENGNVSISLPVLTATQQALFTAASRLLPVGSLGHHAPETPDEALAAAHAAGMSYPGAEVNGGKFFAPILLAQSHLAYVPLRKSSLSCSDAHLPVRLIRLRKVQAAFLDISAVAAANVPFQSCLLP